MTQSPGQPPVLSYATKPRAMWLRRHQRKFIVAAVLFFLASLGWKFWEPTSRWVRYQYWARKCMAYRRPAKLPDQLTPSLPSDYSNARTIEEQELNFPTPLRKLYELCFYNGWYPQNTPITFVGSLQRPDGAQRLAIIAGRVTYNTQVLTNINVAVLPSPSIFQRLPAYGSPPTDLDSGLGIDGGFAYIVELQSATSDSTNPSHLIVDYEIYGYEHADMGAGKLDFFLQNDDTFLVQFQNESVARSQQLTLRKPRLATALNVLNPPTALTPKGGSPTAPYSQ